MDSWDDLVVGPGHGLPSEAHQLEDEIFHVTERSVEIVSDDLAGLGNRPTDALFYRPRGKMHGFRNGGAVPARLLLFMTSGRNMHRMFAA
jgi:hypothetical protein